MDSYTQLLDATVQHLQRLKQTGVRYLTLGDEGLAALRESPRPAVRRPVPAAPAPALRRPTAPPQPSAPPPARPAPVPAAAPAPPVPRPAAVPVLKTSEGLSKAEALEELRSRALVCQKCPNLASSRRSVVWGVGSIDASLMFIGEAPGADEDAQGEPFVGKAGQMLTKIIQTMGLSRASVYIANILKCRPDTPGQNFGNRPPTPKEIENCLPYLHAQIDLIQPKLIVALGATAVDGLFGRTPGMGITRLRGQWREYRGIPVMLTFHPSYLLRENINNVKRQVWEDMLQVLERLSIPISEKQRGYFLKS